MPLLRREPFVRQKPPANIGLEDEVYLCKLTGEVFTDYEKFFESTILCNSLVWTCSLTGRPGLTFQEALESEKKAMLQLNSFPEYLKRPLLYLATLTHRTRLADMNDDLFMFSKDRYFIGETVEAITDGERKLCRVTNVMPPESAKPQTKPIRTNDSDSDVICLDDDDDDNSSSNEKVQIPNTPNTGKSPAIKDDADHLKMFGVDPNKYQYVLQGIKCSTIYIVQAANISRKRSALTKEKCKLFLKHHCSAQQDGIFRVKAESVVEFQLKSAVFINFFDGPTPQFEKSETKRKPASLVAASSCKASTSKELTPTATRPVKAKKVASQLGEKCGTSGNVIDLTDDDDSPLPKKKQLKDAASELQRKENAAVRKSAEAVAVKEQKALAAAQRLQMEADFQRLRQEITDRALTKEKEKQNKLDMREEMKRKAEEEKQKRKNDRDLERAKQREEKRVKDEEMRVWNKPRDDLECDDLKAMPIPTPIKCLIPVEVFGDALLILEYLLSFKPLFKLELPENITIDVLGKALVESDVKGLYPDLVRQLLSAIFRLQEEQYEEETDAKGVAEHQPDDNRYEDVSVKELVKAATAAAQWPMLIYGTSLKELPLDDFSLTEILRLHFLSSGAFNRTGIKFDYQRRGGFTPHDDPGLEFRRQEMGLIKSLEEISLVDCTPVEKLKIVNTLIQQLLTYAASRDFIDDSFERLKQVTRDLRNHQSNGSKRDRDEAMYWLKKKMDADGKPLPGLDEKINGSDELLNPENAPPPAIDDDSSKKKKVPTATLL